MNHAFTTILLSRSVGLFSIKPVIPGNDRDCQQLHWRTPVAAEPTPRLCSWKPVVTRSKVRAAVHSRKFVTADSIRLPARSLTIVKKWIDPKGCAREAGL
jgi:hypothetical protein